MKEVTCSDSYTMRFQVHIAMAYIPETSAVSVFFSNICGSIYQ
jgi:hypothetical protein